MNRNCVKIVCLKCGESEVQGVNAVISEWSKTYARFHEYAEAYRAFTAFLDRTFAELEAREADNDCTVPSQGGRTIVPFGRKGSRRS